MSVNLQKKNLGKGRGNVREQMKTLYCDFTDCDKFITSLAVNMPQQTFNENFSTVVKPRNMTAELSHRCHHLNNVGEFSGIWNILECTV